MAGFEPTTPCPPDKCATRLRHTPLILGGSTKAADYNRRNVPEQPRTDELRAFQQILNFDKFRQKLFQLFMVCRRETGRPGYPGGFGCAGGGLLGLEKVRHKKRQRHFIRIRRRAAPFGRSPARRRSRSRIRFFHGGPMGGRLIVIYAAANSARAALFQQLLHPFDRVTVTIKQPPDTPQQTDIIGAVIAPPARPFQRFDLGKLAFPKAQDMLRNVKFFSYLAYRAKGVGGFLHCVIQSAAGLAPV